MLQLSVCDNFRFNPNYVNRFIPKIISYLPLADSFTWQFHVTIFVALSFVTIFVALSSGNVKSIFIFILVVILPSCVCHCIIVSLSGLSFVISILNMILEVHLLPNKIWKLLNFALSFCIFMHPCRIGDWWIFKHLVRL